MSTYLSRPVFEFPINWADTPVTEFNYDLREVAIALGEYPGHRLQEHIVKGIQFGLILDGEAEIEAFEAFVATCKGRLNGFWIRSREAAARITAGLSATQFKVEDQGWRNYWSSDDTPCQHIELLGADGTILRGQIASVVSDNAGAETVTMTASLGLTIDDTWTAYRLLYVRFASDDFDATAPADNREIRTVRIVELPAEYAAAETGLQPVYLYEVKLRTTPEVVWRYTSFPIDVASSGNTWTAVAISHRSHSRRLGADASSLLVESWHDATNPFAMLFPGGMPKPLWVRVLRIDYTEPDAQEVVFHGAVSRVSLSGRKIVAECESVLAAIGRRFPRFYIQPRCNYVLFSAPCGVEPANYRATGTIDDMGGRKVQLSGFSHSGKAANWYALGYATVGASEKLEIRQIESSTEIVAGVIQLTLTEPLYHSTIGNLMTVNAGCDGAAATCKDKFSNFDRFGGHVLAPQNLSVRALEAETSTGNKK